MDSQALHDLLVSHYKIGMVARFVPFSVSRHKGEKSPSLNYKVTLSVDGREILKDLDYSMGCAYCPSYKQNIRLMMEREILQAECEHGKQCFWRDSSWGNSGAIPKPFTKPVFPDLCNVVHALLLDGEAIEYSNFEEWCNNTGCNSDSIKDKKCYEECLQTGLALRNALGDSKLASLREAFQEY